MYLWMEAIEWLVLTLIIECVLLGIGYRWVTSTRRTP